MSKHPPLNIRDQREALKRDAAARWLAKYDKRLTDRRVPKHQHKGGARC